MSEIIVHPKKGNPFRFSLPEREITIGRLPSNDLTLADQFSSGTHAAIFPTPEGYSARDMGSKNGTSVNDQRITGEVALKKGDKILVGSTYIYFEDYKTEVVITPRTDISHSSNTIIQVQDILKPPTAAFPKTSGGGGGRGEIEIERDRRISRILADVEHAMICHMTLDKLLEHIMDLITKNIPMDRGVLMLKEGKPEQLNHRVVRVLDHPQKAQQISISQSIVQTALDKNSAVLISDVQSDEHLREQKSILKARTHSAMCVPLWNDKEIIGLVYADRISILEQFKEDDLRFLTILANTAALKIESARSIQAQIENEKWRQQMLLAGQIQKNLLPKSDPVFGSFDISGSTRASYDVGGDYYDFISIDSTRLGVVIADVSGTGVSAALLMSNFRGSIHSEIPRMQDIAELTARLNDKIYSSTESHIFISFFFGILDREKGEMTYINAGHNPPLLLKGKGRIHTLDSTGFCLGMFPSAAYEMKTVSMASGDLLCIFTDGIVESRDKALEEYGDERLAALLKESADLPSREVMDRIYEAVFAFTECTEAGDDMTLIVVKRNRDESS